MVLVLKEWALMSLGTILLFLILSPFEVWSALKGGLHLKEHFAPHLESSLSPREANRN